MTTISGRPDRMLAYGDVTAEMAAGLRTAGARLAHAVGAFRDRWRWHEFMSGVPPVELDVDANITGAPAT